MNREVILMYREIGAYVSDKVKNGGWGKAIVKDFSEFIQSRFVGIQGFSASNIWRMRQFYETYKDNEHLMALTREINWSNNLKIMARAKTEEAREFYLLLTAKNRYSTSELERQIDSMIFERTMISDERNKLFIAKSAGLAALRDSYVLEFPLRRSISPALVANYQLHLPNKKLLEDKLRELTEIAEVQNEDADADV